MREWEGDIYVIFKKFNCIFSNIAIFFPRKVSVITARTEEMG